MFDWSICSFRLYQHTNIRGWKGKARSIRYTSIIELLFFDVTRNFLRVCDVRHYLAFTSRCFAPATLASNMPLLGFTNAPRGPLASSSPSCVDQPSDFFIENLWGGRQARRRGNFHPSVPPPRRETPAASVSGQDGDRSNGEFWWRQALERHTGIAGAISQTIPWEALCHSLATYFLEVLGEEGRDRPLQVGATLSSVGCHGCPLGDTASNSMQVDEQR